MYKNALMDQLSYLNDDSNGSLLHFSITEGQVNNEFLRQGPVAAHLVQTSGLAPRLLVAFPAGNSAVGLWCVQGTALQWLSPHRIRAVRSIDDQGRPQFGIEVEFDVDSSTLTIKAAVLGSARVLRDYQISGYLPDSMQNQVSFGCDHTKWSRTRLDDKLGYALTLQAPGGYVDIDEHGLTRYQAAPSHPLHLRLVALCGEAPMEPIDMQQLLRQPSAGPLRARQSLTFLSYRDKLLAGSWRFNTYFGRDTLMSLLLLLPALTPDAIEAGLSAVLKRLGQSGEVAHEEDIGEWAVLHGSVGAAPRYDYQMIDDDFMLAPVVAAYLLNQPEGRQRAAVFLARSCSEGHTLGAALARNFQLVLDSAASFARLPSIDSLIRLKHGRLTGDWRDSADGLGGGTICYSVNAVLVPAALRSIAALVDSGLLVDYLQICASEFTVVAEVWERQVPEYFSFTCSAEQMRDAVLTHAIETDVDPAAALASLSTAPLKFQALALDTSGKAIPVMHSDLGFALTLQSPPAAVIECELSAIMRPFPAGLMTDVGLLVANGAYAEPNVRTMFGPDRYHGAVVWSWQQALLAAGLARQLQRADLPASTRTLIAEAESTLWKAINRTQEYGNSELWSWRWQDGVYKMHAFGFGCPTSDESNAVQLWSTVYLAVHTPHISYTDATMDN